MKTRIMLNGKDNRRVIGIGVAQAFTDGPVFDAQSLDSFIAGTSARTRFVTLSYELGRKFMPASFASEDRSGFPPLQAWTPETLYTVHENDVVFAEGTDSEENRALALAVLETGAVETEADWKALHPRESYIESVKMLRQHIQRGDIYETNFCQEFYAENIEIASGPAFYNKLDEVTKAPFSVYYETGSWLIASASPERFILKENNRIMSQPIKGTAPRNPDPETDARNRQMLAESDKDKAENVMIVDLVRNDLSRIAAWNSVRVDELFGIHTFPTVHQMISTVSCELRESVSFSDILEATFPMGSMTGAPKMSAVKLSDRYEGFSRGIYSGSIGYISPGSETFDLNVMIRSLVYDKAAKRLSCCVGGAITIASDPEAEYEECRTKVGRILEIFGKCQW